MATTQFKGQAQFTYQPAGSPPIVHKLAIPLLAATPIVRSARSEWWAADNAHRDVVVLDTQAIYEIAATVRFENEPQALLDLLRLCLEQDLVLTYEKVLGTPIQLKLVAAGNGNGTELSLSPDDGRFGFGEYMVDLQVRRVDGGNLAELL